MAVWKKCVRMSETMLDSGGDISNVGAGLGGDILQTVTSVKNAGEVLNARLTEFPVPGN